MKIRLRESVVERKSRLALYAVLDCNLRLMENWRTLNLEVWGRQLDYETMMVLMAVVVTNGEKVNFESLDQKFWSLEHTMPTEVLRSRCTIASLADATALNRETVRRKVKVLENLAILVRDEQKNVRFGPNILSRPEMRKALFSQLNLLVRSANHMSTLGIVERTH